MEKCTNCNQDTAGYSFPIGDGCGEVLCDDCASLPEFRKCSICGIRGCDALHEDSYDEEGEEAQGDLEIRLEIRKVRKTRVCRGKEGSLGGIYWE